MFVVFTVLLAPTFYQVVAIRFIRGRHRSNFTFELSLQGSQDALQQLALRVVPKFDCWCCRMSFKKTVHCRKVLLDATWRISGSNLVCSGVQDALQQHSIVRLLSGPSDRMLATCTSKFVGQTQVFPAPTA